MEEHRPLVSVIAPVYRVEEYLPKMIVSVLIQTFKDFELLLVDDGSPDRCGEICDEAARKDKRVKVIHKSNGGAADARNAAMAVAQGRYFHFVDSDDWIEPDMLEKLVHEAWKTGAMLTITGMSMEYYENGEYPTYDISPNYAIYPTAEAFRENMGDYLIGRLIYQPVAKLYDADRIRNNHIVFPKTLWDDTFFNLDYLMDVESVVFIPGTEYHYFRSRPGSETANVFFDTNTLFEKRKEQLLHILKLYKYWNMSDERYLEGVYNWYASRLIQCVEENAAHPGLNHKEKRKRIENILNDEQTSRCLKIAKPNSMLIRVALFPMRIHSITMCYYMGGIVGFMKTRMSRIFNQLFNKTIHHAEVRER